MTGAIPFHRPSIGDEEIEGVVRVLRSGWLTTGGETAAFEEEFREAVGAEHAVAVSSGTAALELALRAFDVGPGDKVITTPLTFVATVEAILRVGARPVFADVDGATGCLDPAAVAERMTENTRALLPVHLAGHPADLGGRAAFPWAPPPTRRRSVSMPTRTSPRAREGWSPFGTVSGRDGCGGFVSMGWKQGLTSAERAVGFGAPASWSWGRSPTCPISSP